MGMSDTRQIGGRTVDLDAGEVVGFGTLAQRELSLLKYFLKNPDRTIGPDELLREVWGFAEGVRTRAVYTAVYRLRSLIEEDPNEPRFILSERGNGYRFRPQPAERKPWFPAPLDVFVGREPLLQALTEALGHTRMLTLVGGPGIGKSRLAMQLGALWQREEREVLLLSGRSGLLGGLASALGLLPSQDADVFELVRGALASRTCLLVVDDTDELWPADRLQLAEIVAAVGGLSLLATARAPLGLTGEHVVEVGPLGLETSMVLLSVRVGPSVAVPEEVLRALAERLEGIPLALELAASLVHLLGAAPSLELLKSSLAPLQLVAGPHRPGLAAAIDRSWIALAEEDRGQLAALATFEGSFTLAAASAVLQAEAVGVVARLRGRSLLFRTPHDRFGMFDAVREFVRQRVEPEVWRELRGRHAAWCWRWVEGLPSQRLSAVEREQRLDAELANLRAALDTLVASGQEARACAVLEELLVWRIGSLQEMVGYATRGVALAPDPATRSRFEAHRARHLRAAHRFGEALKIARQAAESSVGADDRTRLEALRCLLNCCVVSGEQAEGLAVAEELLQIASRMEDLTRLIAEIEVARVYVTSSDPAVALRRLQALEGRLASYSSESLRAHADAVRAFALMRLDPPRAELELARLEQWCLSQGHVANAHNLALARAHLLLRAGRQIEARALLDTKPLGDPPPPFVLLLNAWCAWLEGDRAACRRHVYAAIEMARRVHDPFAQTLGVAALAQLEREEGRTDEALALLDEAALVRRDLSPQLHAWKVVLQAEREDEGATRLVGALDPALEGAKCAHWLLEGGPAPQLGPDHDLMDRIGLDLTLRRDRPSG
jgi:hypothetical protein